MISFFSRFNKMKNSLKSNKIYLLKNRILNLIIIIKNLKYSLPQKSKYLIIDKRSKSLQEIFNIEKDSTIIATRNEEFYLSIILYSLIKFKFSLISDFYTCYIRTFIDYVSPKLLLTYIHNNKRLWKISENKDLRLLIFQNGYLSPSSAKPNKYNTSKDTIFLTLTNERAEIYKNKGVKSFAFGSVQSNSVTKVNSKIKKRQLIFVSQFRNILEKKDYYKNNYQDNLSVEEFYYYDKKLLKISNKFAKDFNLNLKFLAMSDTINKIKIEKRYYSLDKYKIKLIKKHKTIREKFKLIDESFMIIGIDSALLYESLGRGKKTFFCTCRGFNKYGKSIRPFLDSTIDKKNGDFWTNVFDEKLIYDLLQRMYNETKQGNNDAKSDDLKQVPYYNTKNLNFFERFF